MAMAMAMTKYVKNIPQAMTTIVKKIPLFAKKNAKKMPSPTHDNNLWKLHTWLHTLALTEVILFAQIMIKLLPD